MANILATRQHQVLGVRADQINTNLLAYHGGKPYIDARLSRFPAESDTDFYGDASTRPPSIGRMDRAFLINFARRIATKINQYVFQTAVMREGVDTAFLTDCTATGMSLNQFMSEVSSLVTVGRWSWIGIDRPPAMGARSVLDRERSGDRIYWQLYSPTEVVDWSMDASGGVNWLLTEMTEYRNASPREKAEEIKVRYLWERGLVTRMELSDKGDDFKAMTETKLALNRVPFILAGLVDKSPWWFDDVERIQRAVLDMLSSRDTQIFKAVFALLVVSQSFAQAMKIDGITEAAARRKIGLGNPLFETADESGLTRYLDVPVGVFETIRNAVQDLQGQLMDVVGLGMSVPESRQVASAEAKQWDHLDPETVLRERATLLEEVEGKAVELSAELGGPVFRKWTPMYAKKFDISDFQADMAALTTVSGFSLPPAAEKLVLKAVIQGIGKRFGAEPKDLKEALDELAAFDPAAAMAEAAAAVAERMRTQPQAIDSRAMDVTPSRGA